MILLPNPNPPVITTRTQHSSTKIPLHLHYIPSPHNPTPLFTLPPHTTNTTHTPPQLPHHINNIRPTPNQNPLLRLRKRINPHDPVLRPRSNKFITPLSPRGP